MKLAYLTVVTAQSLVTQEILQLFDAGVPVIFRNIASSERAKLPLMISKEQSSALLMVDKFHDPSGGVHYRVIDLPAVSESNASYAMVSPIERSEGSVQVTINSASQQAEQDIEEYEQYCGGSNPEVQVCWNFMTSQHSQLSFQDQVTEIKSMVPDQEAVWREVVETTYKSWDVQWSDPYPFKQRQTVTHRLNVFWYLYVQAPPFQQLYYAFVMVDGLHNSNTQLSDQNAVGLYLSNLQIGIQALLPNDQTDPDNLFWIKSSPPTQNTKHEIGRSWSSTDSYSMNMNLGFKGEMVEGGMNFNYTKSFTASYSETREITDFSVIENTDGVHGRGEWQYAQTWPVNMLINNGQNFPQNWETYYEQSWNPCRVKDVPNLSKYSIATHNSMVWGIKDKLRVDHELNVKFKLNFLPKLSAHTCEVFDGHHKLFQVWMPFQDVVWTLNVADLNNISYK